MDEPKKEKPPIQCVTAEPMRAEIRIRDAAVGGAGVAEAKAESFTARICLSDSERR